MQDARDAQYALSRATPAMHEALVNGHEDDPLRLAACIALTLLAVCFVVALRPKLVFRLATWLGVTMMLVHAARFDMGQGFRNYCTGTSLGTLSLTSLLLLLTDPMVQCRHETQTRSLADMSFGWKMYNTLCILVNARGIGWNYQIPHIPIVATETRARFLLQRTLRIVGLVLLADAAQTYMDLNPIFSLPEDREVSIRSQGIMLRALNTLAYGGRSYCALSLGYDVLAVVSVLLGLSEPKAWPPMLGRASDAYTVRRFWSRVWQQIMLRYLAAGGKFAAHALGLARGTSWLSARIQLVVAFTISGIAHLPGDMMVHPKWAGASFWFFPAQVAAITLEDFVIIHGKRLGVRGTPWVRSVGYLWTAVWFTYSAPLFIDWAVQAGLARDRLFDPAMVLQASCSIHKPEAMHW